MPRIAAFLKTSLRRPRVLIGIAAGAVALVLYTITMAPDVLPHDSGDWQAAGATWGLSHAPGSPAYMIAANLFALVPLGKAAARVDFVSAVMGALTIVSLYTLMLLLFDRLLPALVAAATLAVAGEWWSQSSVAAPYNVVPLTISVLLSLLIMWRRRGDVRLVWVGAAVAGAGLAWHPSLLYFMPVLLAGLFIMGPWRKVLRPKPLLATLLLALAGISLYAYVPIRSAADPPIKYAEIDSLESFYRYTTAADIREEGKTVGVLRMPSITQLTGRLSEVVRQSYYPSYAFLVFGPAIILLYPAVWPAIRPCRRPLLFIMIGMVSHMAVVFTVSGIYAQYYLPLLLYFSIWAGFSVFLVMAMGEAYLGERVRYLPVLATGLIYFGVLVWGVQYTWDFVNHRHDDGMRDFLTEISSQAKPDAIILANWDAYSGLTYLQQVDGERRDLRLFSVTKENWRDILPAAQAERPGAQVMLAFTLPVEVDPHVAPRSGLYPLGIKGRTYQDFVHGEPFPAAGQLFEVV